MGPVGRSKSGLQITKRQSGRGGRSVSRSPRPSARAVPPRTQKGMSLPICPPTASSASRGMAGAYLSRSSRSKAATSALPPPRPA